MPKQCYVVRTYAGYEEAAKKNVEKRIEAAGLGARISRVWVPTKEQCEFYGLSCRAYDERKGSWSPKHIVVEMEMDHETRHLILETTGVVKLVQEIERELHSDQLIPHSVIFYPNERIRVIKGVFAGSQGYVTNRDKVDGTLTVGILLFGRHKEITVDPTFVERLIQ